MFAFWFLIIPGIAGIVLLIMQILETNNLIKKYGHIDQLNNSISSLEKQIEDTKSSLFSTIDNLNMEIQKKKNECTELQDEILMLEKDTFCKHYTFSDYDGLTSEECKNELSLLKNKEQDAIRSSSVLNIYGSGTKKRVKRKCKTNFKIF